MPTNNPQNAEDFPLQSSSTYQATYPLVRATYAISGGFLAPRLRVSGRHHIPLRGGVLLTPNHIADLDWPYLFGVTPRPLWFMAKRELFTIPVLGPIVRFCQAFPVERGSADRGALRHTEELLQAGRAVVIFPEGKCSLTGEMGPVLPGAVMIALHTGVPVVPVGISGTNVIMPPGTLKPRPTLAPVRFHFGPPIHFKDLMDMPRREQRAAATQRLEDAIHAARDVAQGR